MSTAAFTTLSASGGTVPTETLRRGSSKSWMNLNGTGTIAIRDSFNVSSATDGGVGNYTQNLTAAMANTNYAVNGQAEDAGGVNAAPQGDSNGRTSSANRILDVTTNTRAAIDVLHHMATILGAHT